MQMQLNHVISHTQVRLEDHDKFKHVSLKFLLVFDSMTTPASYTARNKLVTSICDLMYIRTAYERQNCYHNTEVDKKLKT
jgi:hypothetical protein